MARTKTAEPKTPSQSQRFAEAARAADCDEDESQFDARLRRVAKAEDKPQPGHKKS